VNPTGPSWKVPADQAARMRSSRGHWMCLLAVSCPVAKGWLTRVATFFVLLLLLLWY
jgi:hypothetical protein